MINVFILVSGSEGGRCLRDLVGRISDLVNLYVALTVSEKEVVLSMLRKSLKGRRNVFILTVRSDDEPGEVSLRLLVKTRMDMLLDCDTHGRFMAFYRLLQGLLRQG